MISCKFLYDCLIKRDVDFFTGIPGSLFKDFCSYITDHTCSNNQVIAANEGAAVAIACGHYLATKRISLVYMQNSGQGNATNPLVSLADADVYGIPMLLFIGWRGEPGKKDEPQHLKQGKITLSFLETLDIPYKILPQTTESVQDCLEDIFSIIRDKSAPAALIVKKGTFEPYVPETNWKDGFDLTREDAIKLVVQELALSDIVISTTGKTSRELYEYRNQLGHDHSKDFLTVGSMGHASQVALGIALSKPSRQVFCLDGDGAVIMHMGSLAIIGSQEVPNFKHIIINNGSHDSVGGQPTVGFSISFTDIAKDCGYQLYLCGDTAEKVTKKMKILRCARGPALLEIKVKRGARPDLGRPKTSPKENKISFMEFLSK